MGRCPKRLLGALVLQATVGPFVDPKLTMTLVCHHPSPYLAFFRHLRCLVGLLSLPYLHLAILSRTSATRVSLRRFPLALALEELPLTVCLDLHPSMDRLASAPLAGLHPDGLADSLRLACGVGCPPLAARVLYTVSCHFVPNYRRLGLVFKIDA